MRTITAEELKVILEKHKEWLDSDGVKGERANLSNANLSCAYLFNANLSGAYLFNANLSYADLSHANLSNANLSNANLSYATLSYTDLFNAYLFKANLFSANLSKANLSKANLSNASLSYVSLQHVKDVISFTLGKHYGFAWKSKDKEVIVKIGCLEKPLEEWLKDSKAIGIKEGYSLEDRLFYRGMLKLIKRRFK